MNQNKMGLSDLLMASVPAPIAMMKQSHHHIHRSHFVASARQPPAGARFDAMALPA